MTQSHAAEGHGHLGGDSAGLRDHSYARGARIRRSAASAIRAASPATLLATRIECTKRLDAGERPTFLEATKSIREGDWKVAPLPQDLQCRRVEITGPVERKMIINAPNWDNQIVG